MKPKIVLWGSNAQDEKLLIAVALRAEENKLDIWTFPESVATEDFYQQMMKDWRDGEGLEFPEQHTHIERELSLTESLLPDDLKAERTDVIHRAQTEWHFSVLSSKLHQSYQDQLDEIKERVHQLEKFDQGVWDNLRDFWAKVQEQVKERNLFREHADSLRDNINALFSDMKGLRKRMDDEFERISKETLDKFFQTLEEIEKKADAGARVPVIFDELKKLQRKFRESDMTRDHRNKVWEKLDGTFKNIKQKRFGAKAAEEGNSAYQRLKRRFEGLVSAIEKMEQSIQRDRDDLEFQQHKIDTTSGQLEAQIRQAKIIMIEERVHSKQEKLNEMNSTKVELEKRLESLKEKEARRVAQEAVKEKIAENIKAAAEARVDEADKLEKAAEMIAESHTATEDKKSKKTDKTESLISAAGAALGESIEDVIDTVKAVASVIGDKIEDAIEDIKEEIMEEVQELQSEEETTAENNTEAPVSEEAAPVQEEEPVTAEGEPETNNEAPASPSEVTTTPDDEQAGDEVTAIVEEVAAVEEKE